ncbi:hypothetical protein WA556_003329 [Blastocystis sp. ATCC 50177/Nand II]
MSSTQKINGRLPSVGGLQQRAEDQSVGFGIVPELLLPFDGEEDNLFRNENSDSTSESLTSTLSYASQYNSYDVSQSLDAQSSPLFELQSSPLFEVSSSTLTSMESSPVVSTHSSPLLSTYSSPLLSTHSSPLLSTYSSPLLSTHSSPLLSTHSYPLLSTHSYPLLSTHSSPLLSTHSYPLLSTHSSPLLSTHSSPFDNQVTPTTEEPSVLNSFLHKVFLQKAKAAKERRMKRMAILRMKRMSGKISFDSSLRYEKKKRR